MHVLSEADALSSCSLPADALKSGFSLSTRKRYCAGSTSCLRWAAVRCCSGFSIWSFPHSCISFLTGPLALLLPSFVITDFVSFSLISTDRGILPLGFYQVTVTGCNGDMFTRQRHILSLCRLTTLPCSLNGLSRQLFSTLCEVGVNVKWKPREWVSVHLPQHDIWHQTWNLPAHLPSGDLLHSPLQYSSLMWGDYCLYRPVVACGSFILILQLRVAWDNKW